jgi:DNA invertase Pin-like site-specific DNA recombinase
MCERFIGLVRVSSERQGESRLGLESGHAEINRYVAATGTTLITVLEEVESGTHDDIVDRPTLLKALTLCRRHKACLLVPRVDRLVRSTSVHTDIRRSGVKVRFVDNPHADEFTIDILVSAAADAGRKISQTTKNSLKAYSDGKRVSKRLMAILNERYQGNIPQEAIDEVAGKLGADLVGCHLTDADRAKGRAKGTAKQAKAAIAEYKDEAVIIKEMHSEGHTLRAIADRLNSEGHITKNGTAFGPVQVKRILNRIGVDTARE